MLVIVIVQPILLHLQHICPHQPQLKLTKIIETWKRCLHLGQPTNDAHLCQRRQKRNSYFRPGKNIIYKAYLTDIFSRHKIRLTEWVCRVPTLF